jgi:formamidopyrimidine-DNA glycosylase
MPELPEVETIVLRLRDGTIDHPPVRGQAIDSVQVTWPKIIAMPPNPELFKVQLSGKIIIDVQRRGKYFHFILNEGHLLAHLRMSGDMRMEKRWSPTGEPLLPENYDRVVINFKSDWRLAFSNIRKFGRMWYVNDPDLVLGELGPEPLSEQFTPEQLYERLCRHHRQIKPLLMDQHFIAGLGNIYTDESLLRARIHPLRSSDTLTKAEAQALHRAIQETLKEGIRSFGASLDWIYRGGEFQNYFNAYGQTGKPCPRCSTPIQKIVVGQRGTHFCPKCQQLPTNE